MRSITDHVMKCQRLFSVKKYNHLYAAPATSLALQSDNLHPSCQEVLTLSQWVRHGVWRLSFVWSTSERYPNLSTMMCVIAPLLHRCKLTEHYHVQAFVQDPDMRKLQCQQSDKGRAWAGGLAEPRRSASRRQRAPTLVSPMRTAGVRILRVGMREKHHFFQTTLTITSRIIPFLPFYFQSGRADKTVLTAAFVSLPGCPLLHPIDWTQLSHYPCE